MLPEVRNDLANLTDLDLWHNVDDIHVEDIELGEIPVEGFNEDIELEAVVILQQCCKDLVKEWSDRLTPNPLIRNAQELFTTDNWFTFGDEESDKLSRNKLEAVLRELNCEEEGFFSDKFELFSEASTSGWFFPKNKK